MVHGQYILFVKQGRKPVVWNAQFGWDSDLETISLLSKFTTLIYYSEFHKVASYTVFVPQNQGQMKQKLAQYPWGTARKLNSSFVGAASESLAGNIKLRVRFVVQILYMVQRMV